MTWWSAKRPNRSNSLSDYDGSVALLETDSTGVRIERFGALGEVVLIEIAKLGEEPIWIQIRAVGNHAGLRIAYVGESGV